jgi:DNA-binding PadR family transcriptional regulator
VAQRTLTATSFVVLGMLTYAPATSYQLKRRVASTIGNFWAFNHSQLYDEPSRLTAAGLVTVRREEGGRRRRTYTISDDGRAALAAWLAEPAFHQTEVRDLGLLKLFFGSLACPADLATLAHDQRQAHRDRADGYEAQRARVAGAADDFQLATLELGIRYERTVEKFWDDWLNGRVGVGLAEDR